MIVPCVPNSRRLERIGSVDRISISKVSFKNCSPNASLNSVCFLRIAYASSLFQEPVHRIRDSVKTLAFPRKHTKYENLRKLVASKETLITDDAKHKNRKIALRSNFRQNNVQYS